MNPTTIRRAWQLAGRIVASRPWLDVSWVGGDGVPCHLVVHDGPFGAALHFDDDEGPTWEPRSLPDESLGWEDVEDIDALSQGAVVDWVECWGTPAQAPELTAKAAIYTLIAHLLDDDSIDGRWAARPARLVHYTDESAGTPGSAFSLATVFSSLAPTVQWYLDQITSPSWGEGTVWHEPLWLVTRDDQPRLVLDEAGQVHMAADSLPEVLDVMAAAANLGGIDDLWSFDLLDALTRLSLPGLTRLGSQQIGHEPDVLALDPPRRLLYVASESGILTTINTTTRAGRVTGRDMLGDNAHIVAVDPSTGEAYLPLRTGPRGRPELLIETPTDVQAKS